MEGLGESVIYNKWWNSLSLAIWLHTKDAKCKYGWMPPKQHHQVPQGGRAVPASTLPLGNTNATERHFLLYGSPFLFMILAVSYRKKNTDENWLLKTYYSKWINLAMEVYWPEVRRPQVLRVNLLSSDCFITVIYFSVKQKQNSEMLQNQSIKKCTSV